MFIDTNIFLRVLLADHPQQSPACREVFLALESGEMQGWTSDVVIAEIVYILTGPIMVPLTRVQIRDRVLTVTQFAGLQTPSKSLWHRIFELYTSKNVDFNDAYNAALVEQRGETEVMTYDRDFDGLAGLERREPPPIPV